MCPIGALGIVGVVAVGVVRGVGCCCALRAWKKKWLYKCVCVCVYVCVCVCV
jgi:hypothetical protein